MSDLEVIDLSAPDPIAPNRGRQPVAHPGRTPRLLGGLILLLLAVGGLRVHAVRAPAVPEPTTTSTPRVRATEPAATSTPTAAPIPAAIPLPGGPPARSTGGLRLSGTGSRLLLLGATLTTYDVSSGAVTRPFGPDADGTVLGAAPLADGDVVVESLGFASGKAYAIAYKMRKSLGVATSVIPGAQLDTAWLIDSPETGRNRVRLVSLSGALLRGPFEFSSNWRIEQAVPGGLLVAIGDARQPFALHLWTPGSDAPGPLIADDLITEAAGAGKVLTVAERGGVAVNGKLTGLPGDAVDYAVSTNGSTYAALGSTSLTVVSPAGGLRVVALPDGSDPASIAFAPSGWLFVSLGTTVLALAPGATELQAIPVVFADPPGQVLAASTIGIPVNPRVGR